MSVRLKSDQERRNLPEKTKTREPDLHRFLHPHLSSLLERTNKKERRGEGAGGKEKGGGEGERKRRKGKKRLRGRKREKEESEGEERKGQGQWQREKKVQSKLYEAIDMPELSIE